MGKRKICCNCKHGGDQFKIGKLTHLHCCHPDVEVRNPRDKEDTGWDSLNEFSSTCDHFEFKEKKEDPEEDPDDEPEFERCSECDGHDACADFGCAYELGCGNLVNNDPNIV